MSKLDDYLNQITHVYTALSRKVIADLQEQLADAEPADVADIVRTIWDKWDVPGEYRDMLLDGAVKATEISVAVEAPIVFKSFYAQSVSLDGVKLSAKINDVMRTNETEALIRDAMQNQITIKNLAVKLVDEDLSSAKLPKYMEDLLTKARQAADLTGDTEAYAKYRRALSRATRQIDTLKDADDTSKLARAYRDVAELSTDASEKTVEKTIERAIMQKARANALRLAHTETARAYGNGAVYSAMQDKDAIGIRIELSGDHEGYCICDYFAESDMYGLGEGVYPVDELPEYPFHPYCQCSLSSVYKGDPDAEYDDNAAEAAFDDLDPEERQALVTKSGTWDDLDWKDHKLPKGYDEQIG
jgi:uncharacterized protein YfeS